MLNALTARSLEIFRCIVESYMDTGAPIGSVTLARKMGSNLSSATLRNIMAYLEEAGLLYAPHTSAGRLPTEAGLSFFVNGVLEVGNLSAQERREIESQYVGQEKNIDTILQQASAALSGLAQGAGLVLAPKNEANLTHLEFVPLDTGRALVILVLQDGSVENRLISLPLGFPVSSLVKAGNYMNTHFSGMSLGSAQKKLEKLMRAERQELDDLSEHLVDAGIAAWVDLGRDASLIVHGQANLLNDVHHMQDLERVRHILSILETQEGLLDLLKGSQEGDGVQIFIGADNKLCQMSGCSLVVAPFKNMAGHVIGSLGVIGPSRLNYARVIPMVDYTAKIVGKILG